MRPYLLYCKYDYYCQGTESTHGYFLVDGESYINAIERFKASGMVENPRDFEDKNLTEGE